MKHLDPRYMIILMFKPLLWILPITFFSMFVSKDFGYIFLILVLFAFIYARLTQQNYKYELLPDGFRFEHGILSKKYVTIPYNKIQNVDIYRGIVSRIIGIADVHIQTAGLSISNQKDGGASEGRLPGVSAKEAVYVRDELIRQSRMG